MESMNLRPSPFWRTVLPFHRGQEPLYWWLTRVAVSGLARWGMNFHAFGVEKVPSKGGVILASNHYSNWDPIWIAFPLPRASYFFASEGLFHHPRWGKPLRWLITVYRAIPANPRKPAAALKRARTILERGESLVIFPEGERNFSSRILLPFQTGTALLAALTGTPTVPTYIHRGVQGGMVRWLQRQAPLAAFYGDPLDPPPNRDRETLDRWTQTLWDRVYALARMAQTWRSWSPTLIVKDQPLSEGGDPPLQSSSDDALDKPQSDLEAPGY